MATTWIKALHRSGVSVAAALELRVDYARDAEKTDGGELVDSYECSAYTTQSEFLLSKKIYEQKTGRDQGEHDVIAYHIRMSFKHGEVTAEQALALGRELALRWTKGKHKFIVAAHTNTKNPHCHIVYNSTNLNCDGKYHDFRRSAIALRRLSDTICVEHGLSIVENPGLSKGYNRIEYLGGSKAPTGRDKLREMIDNSLCVGTTFPDLLVALRKAECEIKIGKQYSIKPPGSKKFFRLDTLGADYSADAIRERLAGTRIIVKKSDSPTRSASSAATEKPNLLIDIQRKMQQGYGDGFRHWATLENLKQSAKTLIYLKEVGIDSYEELVRQHCGVSTEVSRRSKRLKEVEKRLADITELQKQIGTYGKTRAAWERYKKSGYDSDLFEIECADLSLHKAAKNYFDKLGLKKLPSINSLKEEWGQLAQERRQLLTGYKDLRERDRALANAKYNCDRILNISPEELERQRQNRAKSQER